MVTAKHQAILDAILDAPDDDELRGVYADGSPASGSPATWSSPAQLEDVARVAR